MNLMYIQFIRFSGVGLVGTLFHYGLLILLVEKLNVGPVPSSTMGFIVGALINYILNYYYTFSSDKKHCVTLVKFLTVALFGMLINGLLMLVFTEVFKNQYLLSQATTTLLVLLWNFTANRCWTFSEDVQEIMDRKGEK